MNVLILIPAYTAINRHLMAVIMQAGLPWLPLYEMSDLPRTRSLLLSMACKHEVERVMLFDSDIVPTVAQVKELASSELVTPTQALTGMYALRGGSTQLSVHAPNAPKDDPAFKAEWAGLGFCAISKESLVRLGNSLPSVVGDDQEWKPYCVPRITPEGVYMADDRSLWWRLAKSGTGLVASRTLHVGHVDWSVRY